MQRPKARQGQAGARCGVAGGKGCGFKNKAEARHESPF